MFTLLVTLSFKAMCLLKNLGYSNNFLKTDIFIM